MKVIIGERVWQMGKKRYMELLKMAKEQVPKGIYAIEKNGQAELRKDCCNSTTQLKALKRQFKSQGYKVYAND